MKNLSRFKVIRNMLVYGEYEIRIIPSKSKNMFLENFLKFVVTYKNKEIFRSDENDSLEDIIETIFELEKDDQEYKDRKAFESCLRNLLSR